MQTETELKLTLDLLHTRKQLIEAHAQIMQYQHRDIETEIAGAQRALDEALAEKDRNHSATTGAPA